MPSIRFIPDDWSSADTTPERSVAVVEDEAESISRADKFLQVADLVAYVSRLAEEIAARPNVGDVAAPRGDLRRLASAGLLTAPLPRRVGGLGLGSEPGGQAALLRILAALGGADLALGRLYEGHVNALILVAAYGSESQIAAAAEDAEQGMLFGVWNTGDARPVELDEDDGSFRLSGTKLFATGAAFVDRAIVTAERAGKGWQMTLVPMNTLRATQSVRVDRGSWYPLGMASSESFGIEFTSAPLSPQDLIGTGGDFYREPLFRGGAIRFAAVHAGAVLRLHKTFAEWLIAQNRMEDPYQLARMGEVALHARESILWVERAAELAEMAFHVDAAEPARDEMVEFANMMRLRIERIATTTIQQVVSGMGARGLLQPGGLERIVRDLTMYLRQPAPDYVLAETGRASLRRFRSAQEGADDGWWRREGEGFAPGDLF